MAGAAGRTRGLRGLYLDGELRGYCGLYPRRSFTADCSADREQVAPELVASCCSSRPKQ